MFSFVSNAQLEASIWYFGEKAGLDFRSGTPVVLHDGQLDTNEGCATISDSLGNLLFYTDGMEVWDRNHNRMPNGTELKGHNSSSQSAIIVPKPNSPNIYYLFTVWLWNGIHYSEIDMNANGGLGDVVVKNVPVIPQGYSYAPPVIEKLTSVVHANGQDIWVLGHGWRNDEFYALKVTSGGVDATPVTSHTGIDFSTKTDAFDAIGYLKASPDGSKLAICHRFIGAELLDFDNTTGIVSNPVTLSEDEEAYGVEFSPSNELLYLSIEAGEVFQYDLNAADIQNSRVSLTEGIDDLRTGALQLAIDGKIYVAESWTNRVSVIEKPNVLGTDSQYVHNAIDLGDKFCKLGFPQFIQSYFYVNDIQAENLCLGQSTEFMVNASEPITSILWDFGDGNTSTLEAPSHIYASSGTYSVEVVVTTASGTEIKTKAIEISEVPTAGMVDFVELCTATKSYDFDLSTLNTEVLGVQDASVFQVTYHLALEDAENNINILGSSVEFDLGSTEIFARISNRNNPSCYDLTNFEVKIYNTPDLFVPADWIVCDTDGDGEHVFDLTLKDSEILNGQDSNEFGVSYYSTQLDADARTNPLANHTVSVLNESLFYRVENIGYPDCYVTGSFSLGIIDQVVANKPTDIQKCDTDHDGMESFDLSLVEAEILGSQSSSSVVVSYHESQSDADGNMSPLPTIYTNNSNQKTIYVRVSNAVDTSCYATTSFQLNLFEVPVVPEVSDWQVCDENNDGFYFFDINEKGDEILSQVDGMSLAFYTAELDAELEQNSIDGNYQNITNPQTVYFRLNNSNNASCYTIGSFALEVFDTPTAYQPLDIVVCDVDENGSYTFDLFQKDAELLNGQDATEYEVTYYANELDAYNGERALSKEAYSNTASQETIYARVHHGEMAFCYDITNFELIINPLPMPNLEELYVMCPDSPDLVLDAGVFESYQWMDAQGNIIGTVQNLEVVELGNYTLTVSDTNNGVSCSNTQFFEVVSSGAPESFEVTMDGFSDQVNLTVDVVGTGNFEYSLDGMNYQDSNRFEVFPGTYTVYVRDTMGCRTISEQVVAIGYQKFFSPNGDGINEHWNIIGGEQYPDAQLFLFDRYGKLLIQLALDGPGWDGTLRGRPMPSTDYWFKFVYENGKTYTGHFSLRR